MVLPPPCSACGRRLCRQPIPHWIGLEISTGTGLRVCRICIRSGQPPPRTHRHGVSSQGGFEQRSAHTFAEMVRAIVEEGVRKAVDEVRLFTCTRTHAVTHGYAQALTHHFRASAQAHTHIHTRKRITHCGQTHALLIPERTLTCKRVNLRAFPSVKFPRPCRRSRLCASVCICALGVSCRRSELG